MLRGVDEDVALGKKMDFRVTVMGPQKKAERCVALKETGVS